MTDIINLFEQELQYKQFGVGGRWVNSCHGDQGQVPKHFGQDNQLSAVVIKTVPNQWLNCQPTIEQILGYYERNTKLAKTLN